MTDQPKELPKPEPPRERSEAFKALLQYINDTPELLSLLYDLNLLPEQLEFPSGDGNRMIMLTRWHQTKSEEVKARAESLEAALRGLIRANTIAAKQWRGWNMADPDERLVSETIRGALIIAEQALGESGVGA